TQQSHHAVIRLPGHYPHLQCDVPLVCDEVSVTADERHVALPVWVMPGQADDCVVALLGFGRRAAGETGSFVGVDVTPLRSASGAVALHPTGKRLVLASSEHHDPLDAVP